MRGLHPLAAVGRDPQPVEPGVRRRRLVGRFGRGARGGTTTLASGSDIGGSIRIPASFNGVVGFKPPYGRVPVDPPFNLDTYCHCGPLARTVADCALYENVLAGPHPSDIVSLRPEARLPDRLRGRRGAAHRAVPVDLGDWPLDPEVRAKHAGGGGRAARRRRDRRRGRPGRHRGRRQARDVAIHFAARVRRLDRQAGGGRTAIWSPPTPLEFGALVRSAPPAGTARSMAGIEIEARL